MNEMGLHILQINTILRTLWSSKSRKNGSKIQLENVRVGFLCIACVVPKALSLGECFNTCKGIFITARESKVFDGTLIHGEESARSTVFWGHVGDGSSICKRKSSHSFTEEFNEFANYTVFTKHFNDSKRHVGCSNAFVQ